MTLKLTDEQRAAVQSHLPGRLVPIRDEKSQRTYFLVAEEDVPALWTDHAAEAVAAGLQAIERGEIVAWNPDAMKERARAAAARAQ